MDTKVNKISNIILAQVKRCLPGNPIYSSNIPAITSYHRRLMQLALSEASLSEAWSGEGGVSEAVVSDLPEDSRIAAVINVNCIKEKFLDEDPESPPFKSHIRRQTFLFADGKEGMRRELEDWTRHRFSVIRSTEDNMDAGAYVSTVCIHPVSVEIVFCRQT